MTKCANYNLNNNIYYIGSLIPLQEDGLPVQTDTICDEGILVILQNVCNTYIFQHCKVCSQQN